MLQTTGKKRRNYLASEAQIQTALVEWAELVHRIKLVHIANEGKRSFLFGKTLKSMGMRKGFPDLILFKARHGFHGLIIEVKPDEKAIVRTEQKQWISELRGDGYQAVVIRSFEEGQAVVNQYLSNKVPS